MNITRSNASRVSKLKSLEEAQLPTSKKILEKNRIIKAKYTVLPKKREMAKGEQKNPEQENKRT